MQTKIADRKLSYSKLAIGSFSQIRIYYSYTSNGKFKKSCYENIISLEVMWSLGYWFEWINLKKLVDRENNLCQHSFMAALLDKAVGKNFRHAFEYIYLAMANNLKDYGAMGRSRKDPFPHEGN